MRIIRHTVNWLLTLVLALSPALTAQAAVIGTDSLLAESSQTTHSRDSLQQLLERDTVQQQLQALGVSPAWAQERARSLSEAELARFNAGVQHLEAGSDSVLGVLLIIFLVFVITDVIGATDIFSFIHPVK